MCAQGRKEKLLSQFGVKDYRFILIGLNRSEAFIKDILNQCKSGKISYKLGVHYILLG
jgi:hypothetical protein